MMLQCVAAIWARVCNLWLSCWWCYSVWRPSERGSAISDCLVDDVTVCGGHLSEGLQSLIVLLMMLQCVAAIWARVCNLWLSCWWCYSVWRPSERGSAISDCLVDDVTVCGGHLSEGLQSLIVLLMMLQCVAAIWARVCNLWLSCWWCYSVWRPSERGSAISDCLVDDVTVCGGHLSEGLQSLTVLLMMLQCVAATWARVCNLWLSCWWCYSVWRPSERGSAISDCLVDDVTVCGGHLSEGLQSLIVLLMMLQCVAAIWARVCNLWLSCWWCYSVWRPSERGSAISDCLVDDVTVCGGHLSEGLQSLTVLLMMLQCVAAIWARVCNLWLSCWWCYSVWRPSERGSAISDCLVDDVTVCGGHLSEGLQSLIVLLMMLQCVAAIWARVCNLWLSCWWCYSVWRSPASERGSAIWLIVLLMMLQCVAAIWARVCNLWLSCWWCYSVWRPSERGSAISDCLVDDVTVCGGHLSEGLQSLTVLLMMLQCVVAIWARSGSAISDCLVDDVTVCGGHLSEGLQSLIVLLMMLQCVAAIWARVCNLWLSCWWCYSVWRPSERGSAISDCLVDDVTVCGGHLSEGLQSLIVLLMMLQCVAAIWARVCNLWLSCWWCYSVWRPSERGSAISDCLVDDVTVCGGHLSEGLQSLIVLLMMLQCVAAIWARVCNLWLSCWWCYSVWRPSERGSAISDCLVDDVTVCGGHLSEGLQSLIVLLMMLQCVAAIWARVCNLWLSCWWCYSVWRPSERGSAISDCLVDDVTVCGGHLSEGLQSLIVLLMMLQCVAAIWARVCNLWLSCWWCYSVWRPSERGSAISDCLVDDVTVCGGHLSEGLQSLIVLLMMLQCVAAIWARVCNLWLSCWWCYSVWRPSERGSAISDCLVDDVTVCGGHLSEGLQSLIVLLMMLQWTVDIWPLRISTECGYDSSRSCGGHLSEGLQSLIVLLMSYSVWRPSERGSAISDCLVDDVTVCGGHLSEGLQSGNFNWLSCWSCYSVWRPSERMGLKLSLIVLLMMLQCVAAIWARVCNLWLSCWWCYSVWRPSERGSAISDCLVDDVTVCGGHLSEGLQSWWCYCVAAIVLSCWWCYSVWRPSERGSAILIVLLMMCHFKVKAHTIATWARVCNLWPSSCWWCYSVWRPSERGSAISDCLVDDVTVCGGHLSEGLQSLLPLWKRHSFVWCYSVWRPFERGSAISDCLVDDVTVCGAYHRTPDTCIHMVIMLCHLSESCNLWLSCWWCYSVWRPSERGSAITDCLVDDVTVCGGHLSEGLQSLIVLLMMLQCVAAIWARVCNHLIVLLMMLQCVAAICEAHPSHINCIHVYTWL